MWQLVFCLLPTNCLSTYAKGVDLYMANVTYSFSCTDYVSRRNFSLMLMTLRYYPVSLATLSNRIVPEEVWQEAGPEVIWRLADAAWLHSFRVWTSHCPYLDHAYLYLRFYLRATVHCLLAHCLVNPKNWSLWWKLWGTAVKTLR